jgi:putative addiction module component (TIGR02574 family)
MSHLSPSQPLILGTNAASAPEPASVPVSAAAQPVTREMLLWQAMFLSPSDREALADALWFSVDHRADDDIERYPLSPAWKAEIDRRLAAYDRGEVETVDAFEHLRILREKYT